MPINYKHYPNNWKTEIRPAVLKRAQNRCEFCGIENYGIQVTGSKVVLTIAHLDHDIKNSDMANLRALCQRCHLKYDIAHHKANARATREKKLNLERIF